MPKYITCLLFIVIISLIIPKKASAQSNVEFEMSYFEDTSSTHSFESVKQEVFKPSPKQLINLGITKSTVWVKLKLDTTLLAPNTVLKINRPFLQNITLSYLIKNNKEVRESLGLNYPLSKNKFNHFLPVFDIPVNNLGSQELYLKVQSKYSMLIPISLSSKDTFYRERINAYLIGGLLIGGLLLMGIYNLFLYFSIRDFSYILYVLSLLSAILSQGYIYGILIQYLSPESPNFSFRFPVIIMALNGIFALLFALRFLEIKKQSKTLFYILISIILFDVFNIILELLHQDYLSRKVNLIQVILLSISILSTAIFSLVKGNKTAPYFTIAWTFYLSGMIIFALKTAGIIPHNNFTNHFMHVGTFLEVMLLSFALGHKYSLIRIEKEKLENQTREELEHLVKLKTAALKTSLAEKEVLLKEIHHRVKNNLQVVISLLDLQAASVEDSKNKNVLTQSRSRIYSMSLIHKKLYQSENLAKINMKDYLGELFIYLKDSYYSGQSKINYSLQIDDKDMSLTKAIPLGLIINELLANSFKYGLNISNNTIKISLKQHQKDWILLVADSGPGFDFDTQKQNVKKSLGLFLVASLTKQLEGTINRFYEDQLFVTRLTTPIEA